MPLRMAPCVTQSGPLSPVNFRDYSHVTKQRQHHEVYLRLASYEGRDWLYVDCLQVRCLESNHGRLDLALVLFHAKQLYHVLDFDLDPWCLVGSCLDCQNALCQAPLLLALTAEHSILLDRSTRV